MYYDMLVRADTNQGWDSKISIQKSKLITIGKLLDFIKNIIYFGNYGL